MVNALRHRIDSSSSQARNSATRERGASEFFMLLLMATLLAFAGLAYDAGMAFNARRDATNLAAAAARAGADDVDLNTLYGTGATVLGPTAEGTAFNAVPTDVDVLDIHRTSDRDLFVKVEIEHEPIFLQIIGISTFKMTGEASAQVKSRSF